MRTCSNISGVHWCSKGAFKHSPGLQDRRSRIQDQKRRQCRRNSDRDESLETEYPKDAAYSEIQAALSSWQVPSGQRIPSQEIKSTGVQSQGKTEAEKDKEVAEALRQVEEALKIAQDKLEDIPNLPSARPRRQVCDSTCAWTIYPMIQVLHDKQPS